ncbi:DUF4238 domain-containing protein [Kitasatospora sp. NPDC015120]|uniref:DUF4238 domain-containing protein n=1 Tax=Kitasatospora sp. NPDC015120 TaxID=3364023 RepID=UPI0036F4A8F0
MPEVVPPPRDPSAAGDPAAFHFDADRVAADFLRRIAELKAIAANPVHRQHMVARVLLDGWAVQEPRGTRRSLQPYRIGEDGSVHQLSLQGARNVGFRTDWVVFGSGSLEQLWERTERRIPKIRAAIAAGIVFHHPDLVEAVADLVALHHVRTNRQHRHFRHWLEQHRPELDLAFARLGHTGDLPDDDQLFRVAAEQLFAFTRSWVSTGSVQIITPQRPQDEFLISDAATLTVRHLHRGDVPDESGVPLAQANCLFLPIGPRHVAAIGSESGYLQAPARMVRGLNNRQFAHCDEVVFTRPGSPLQRSLSDQRRPAGPYRREQAPASG